MTRSSTILVACIAIALLGSNLAPASAPRSTQQTATIDSPAFEVDQLIPDFPKDYLPNEGVVEVFWPNGEIRYTAHLQGGKAIKAEAFTPDGEIAFSMTAGPIATSRTRVGTIAVLRKDVDRSGSTKGEESYIHNGVAVLDLMPEYASIPSATYTVQTINDIFADYTNTPVAHVVDRDTIKLVLPDGHDSDNDQFVFLSHVLQASLDQKAVKTAAR